MGSENDARGLSRGALQVEGPPAGEQLQAVRAVTARADAETSLHRGYPGMAPFQSPSPKASRQASTDPSGCPRQLPRIAPDWQTQAFRRMPQARKSPLSEADSSCVFARPRSMIFAVTAPPSS